MVWYGMVWYGMVWYGMVWCSVLLFLKYSQKLMTVEFISEFCVVD